MFANQWSTDNQLRGHMYFKYRMFVALLIAKTSNNSDREPTNFSSFRTSTKGLIFDYYLNGRTETNISGRRRAGTTYLHMSSD